MKRYPPHLRTAIKLARAREPRATKIKLPPEPPVVPALLKVMLRGAGLSIPVREFQFCDERKWAFDYAWPANRIALEIEGGAWTGGRHTRGGGFLDDMEKYNEAACMGWRVLRCTPDEFNDKTARVVQMVQRAARETASPLQPMETPP